MSDQAANRVRGVPIYGPGGPDATKPNNNIIHSEIVDSDADEAAVTALWGRAHQAVDANNQFLALAAPTNAQVAAQVNRLTRECTALIKLLMRDFGDTSGT